MIKSLAMKWFVIIVVELASLISISICDGLDPEHFVLRKILLFICLFYNSNIEPSICLSFNYVDTLLLYHSELIFSTLFNDLSKFLLPIIYHLHVFYDLILFQAYFVFLT